MDKYDIESTNDLNSSDIIDGDKSPRLQNLLEEDSIKVSEEKTKAESHCSDEDSWIEVKLSGFFESFQGLMLTSLLQKVHVLPLYGQNIAEYFELLTWLLGKGTPDHSANTQEAGLIQGSLTGDVIKCMFHMLHSQNELLANHPNCRIYNTLSSLVEFDGYYLESEPCVACSCPEVPYTRMKLDNLKSETKFTDNRIIVKCTGSHTIQSVTMTVHDARRSKSVEVLNLYYNNRPVADLSELKNNWSL